MYGEVPGEPALSETEQLARVSLRSTLATMAREARLGGLTCLARQSGLFKVRAPRQARLPSHTPFQPPTPLSLFPFLPCAIDLTLSVLLPMFDYNRCLRKKHPTRRLQMSASDP